MPEVAADVVRSHLLAHAGEIAALAQCAKDEETICCVVRNDGTWGGCRLVLINHVRPEAERAASTAFYLPSWCSTAAHVTRFIEENMEMGMEG